MYFSLISVWPLFFGLSLILIGNGLQGSLLGIRATLEGFDSIIIGIVVSAYYWGFLFSSILTPKMVEKVGHVRVFGALTAIASASILFHSIFLDPFLWIIMRVLTGFSYAGMYIIAESWLNNISNNKNRGQILSIYFIISMCSLSIGQSLLGLSDPLGFELFILTSIIISIAAAPILITASPVPDYSAPESLTLIQMYRISPLAIIGVGLNGIANSMVFGMFAVWASLNEINSYKIALILVVWSCGPILMQWPIGMLSDKFDRRLILTICSFASFSLIISLWLVSINNYKLFIILIFLYGGVSLPIYSLCITYANDFLSPKQMTAAAGALNLFQSLGMIIGPPIAAINIAIIGIESFLPTISIFHLLLGVFALWRMTQRAPLPQEAQGGYIPVPLKSSSLAVKLSPELSNKKKNNNKYNREKILRKHKKK